MIDIVHGPGGRARKGSGEPAPGAAHAPGNREKILATALRLFTGRGFSGTPGLVATVSAETDPRRREELIGEGLDIVWNGLKA